MLPGPVTAIGFAVIVILYAVIGLLAAAGSVAVSRKLFPGVSQRLFFGAFLVPIAGFYLAFVAYFQDGSSLRTEALAVILFSLLGIVGIRYSAFLVLGYTLHGIWDALHELAAHAGYAIVTPGQFTEIPLAYGVFCAAFDIAIAVYFMRQKPPSKTHRRLRAEASTQAYQ